MVLTTESLSDAHRRKWGGSSADVKVYRAPGRVNLIGEHTDYTEGFVLPIALDLTCYVTRSKNASGELRVVSENNGQERRWPSSALPVVQPMGDWSDYIVGVAKELFRAGYPVEPANLRVHSTIPMGAGLSSSAAIEVATALALLDGRAIPALDLIQLCRRAENRFVGTPCGVMDQYVCVKAEAGTALEIDCRTLESQVVRLPEDLAIVTVNSMVRHELGQSAYRTRVAECAEARDKLGVRSLRDARMEQVAELEGVLQQRARHVVGENGRVKAFLQAESAVAMGALFYESHASLRDDFAVSCVELDALVEMARGIEGVYGARMTGGGFGGCTVNLMAPEAVARFEAKMRAGYRAQFGLDPAVSVCVPSAGAGRQT
ncbi:MAG: galactokinase [Acidobacteria bacterium]|nr:galactokinase [Acidobacteriota bacterium]